MNMRKIYNYIKRYFSNRYIKDCYGINNTIQIDRSSYCKHTFIKIRGNNNKLIIGKQCYIGNNCTFILEGNNINITIGDYCTFTSDIEINAQENNMQIYISNDCMLSNHIIVRTSDSHPIYDMNTKERLNNPKSIFIGEHVWIAPNSKIMKGAVINKGSIIGSDSMVTTEIPESSLAVGHPAKVVKKNIFWTREPLF